MQLKQQLRIGNTSKENYILRPVILTEARRYMTDREKKLRVALVKLLRDDGKGHHHAKYAERLSKFDINIVSLKDDPRFTAAISFNEGVIYIGEGFLTDPTMFYQLNVLMRHELAHNLLMHEIRMMRHLGDEAWKIFGTSPSLHEILNVIMDDEISNKKYSEDDKKIVRNMYLNGKFIGGLVTEDHRQNWMNMTLEQMYEAVQQELDAIHSKIVKGFSVSAKNGTDPITPRLLQTMPYIDTQSASCIPGSVDDFIKNGCTIRVGNKKLRIAQEYKEVVETIYEYFSKATPDEAGIESLINQLAASHPTKAFDLIHPDSGEVVVTLYSPEQKSIAMDLLKKYRSEYNDWYQKVTKVLNRSNYSASATKQIFQRITKGVTANEKSE